MDVNCEVPRGQEQRRSGVVEALHVGWHSLSTVEVGGLGLGEPSAEYKLIGIHRSAQPIENPCVTRTCESLCGWSNRRARLGVGVAVVDNRRARAGAIRSAIARV